MTRLEEIRRHINYARAHVDEGGQVTNANAAELLDLFEEALSVMLPEQADALDGIALRTTMRPNDRFSRKAVTRASRLLVLAAGGEIVVPFHLADIVDEIELDQIDEPSRSRVIYRARHVRAAAAVIDQQPVVVGGRRMGKTHALAQLTAGALKEGKRVSDGKTGHEIVGVPGYDDGRQIESGQ